MSLVFTTKRLSIAVLLLQWLASCSSLIHHLRIVNDDRAMFKIETFGFAPNGFIHMSLAEFSITNYHYDEVQQPNSDAPTTQMQPHPKIGFVLRRASR